MSTTLHPRTKPEAQQSALKNRTENSWFEHKPVVCITNDNCPKPSRLQGEIANNICKSNSAYQNWFEHKTKEKVNVCPNIIRLKSAEALKCKSKIYGDKQLWYNHDDNKNYFKVTPKRIQPWCDTKTLIQNRYGDSGAWYYGNCSNQPEKTSKKTFADSRSKSNWYHEMSLGKPKTVKFDARVIGQDATSNMEKSRDGSILKIIQGVSISNNQENKVKYTNVKSSSSDWFEHKPRKYPMTSRISNNYKFMKKSSLKPVVTHNCDKNGTVSFKSHSKLTKSPNYHGKHDLNIQKLKNSPIGSDIFSPAHVRNTIIPGNVNVPKLNLSQISVRSNNSQ